MAFKPATRIALSIMLLGSSAIGAQAGWFNSESKKDAAKDDKSAATASTPREPLKNCQSAQMYLRIITLTALLPGCHRGRLKPWNRTA